MGYLVGIFLVIIIIGLLANRELARDRHRVRRMMREYSYKTYAPEDQEVKQPHVKSEGTKGAPRDAVQ